MMRKLVFLFAILGAAQLIGCAAVRGSTPVDVPIEAAVSPLGSPDAQNDPKVHQRTTKIVDVPQDTTMVEVPSKQEKTTREGQVEVPQKPESSTLAVQASGEVEVPSKPLSGEVEFLSEPVKDTQASEVPSDLPRKQEKATQEDHGAGPQKQEKSTKEGQPRKQESWMTKDQEAQVSLKQEDHGEVEVSPKQKKSTQEGHDRDPQKQENSTQASGEVEAPLKQESSPQIPPTHENDSGGGVEKKGSSTQVEVPPKQENSTQGSGGVEVPPKQTQEDDAGDGVEENDSHCCGSRLRSCLSFSGDGSHGELLLHVHSHGVFNVKITPPSFLRVDPSEFKVEKDTKTTVNIEMLDPESAKLQTSAKIVIESEDGPCQIELPSSRSSLVRGFNYPTVRTEVAAIGMLAFALAFFAVGIYCRRQRKQENLTYQQLEMVDHHQDRAASIEHEVSIPVEGWEWEDDWEETEARNSLSSRPSGSMASGRPKITKEGWED